MPVGTKMYDLAIRASRCSRQWYWIDSMKAEKSITSFDIRLPDFTDEGTVKGLLEVVRAAWRNPLISVHEEATGDGTTFFRVAVNYDGLAFRADSDVEALVLALEAADRGTVL